MDADDERDGLAPHAFCCPITQEEMVDPVVASDGHCYERAAIVEWFRQRVPPTSPKTGAVLTSAELVPNHSLRQAIEEWRERQPMALDPARLEVSAQRLGSGSFGDVFAGTLRNGRAAARIEVAVKKLPAMDAQDEKQALEKELKAHRRAALHCDGVCVLYGICELAGQRLGLVMKRYRCSLDVCLREASAGGAPLDDKRVSAWSIKLFRTLRQLHAPECGVVVRDIKPPNILLDAYDEPVLADFGIAEIMRTVSRVPQTSMKGTFNYMAPEAFGEGSVGPPVDVWAMACVVLELHTRSTPWDGMRVEQIITAVRVDKRVPEVPDSAPAAALLRRCFAFAPGERPSAAEVAQALADDAASREAAARRQRAAEEQAEKLRQKTAAVREREGAAVLAERKVEEAASEAAVKAQEAAAAASVAVSAAAAHLAAEAAAEVEATALRSAQDELAQALLDGVSDAEEKGRVSEVVRGLVRNEPWEAELEGAGITDAGAGALAGALEANTSLQKLYLGQNEIEDAGAGALAGALEANTSLRNLDLEGNEITDTGAGALAGALEANSSLHKLNLKGNRITEHARKALLEAWRKHVRSKLSL